MLMLILIMGIAAAFNFMILIWKLKHGRLADFLLDCFCMICICSLFAGGLTILCVGMVASALISLYLLIRPFKVKDLNQYIQPYRR